jgi:hypothetical protein
VVKGSSLNEWKKRIVNRISALSNLVDRLEGLMLKRARRQSSETNEAAMLSIKSYNGEFDPGSG